MIVHSGRVLHALLSNGLNHRPAGFTAVFLEVSSVGRSHLNPLEAAFSFFFPQMFLKQPLRRCCCAMNYRPVESAETKADAGTNQSFLGARFHPPAPPGAIDKAAVTIEEHRHYSGGIKNQKPAEQIESGAVKVTLFQGQGSRGVLPRLCSTFGPTYVNEGGLLTLRACC